MYVKDSKIIGFYAYHLGMRGTETAIFDYARYNEDILNNGSVIFYRHGDPRNLSVGLKKFKGRFRTLAIRDEEYNMHDIKGSSERFMKKLDKRLVKEDCDALYVLKNGADDGIISNVIPTYVHANGMENPSNKHGNKYAYISKWMEEYYDNEIPYVPHMISLEETDEDMREELGIPQDDLVFGRTGGPDTWSLPWVNMVIREVLKKRDDVHFIFQNTPHWLEHKRIHYIDSGPMFWEKWQDWEKYKTRFINTCDAMIHARIDGETFGIACGEFSSRNKAILTWDNSPQKSHTDILMGKGLYYDIPSTLFDLMMGLTKDYIEAGDWNAYDDYKPEPVMQKFKEVFLDD